MLHVPRKLLQPLQWCLRHLHFISALSCPLFFFLPSVSFSKKTTLYLQAFYFIRLGCFKNTRYVLIKVCLRLRDPPLRHTNNICGTQQVRLRIGNYSAGGPVGLPLLARACGPDLPISVPLKVLKCAPVSLSVCLDLLVRVSRWVVYDSILLWLLPHLGSPVILLIQVKIKIKSSIAWWLLQLSM